MKKDYYYSEDITFCTNRKCERKGCMRHWDNYRGVKPYVSVSDFSDICRDYTGYLVGKIGTKKVEKNIF